MKEYIKKFESTSAANEYIIVDIPFTTSIATNPIQNLVCNQSNKKLVADEHGNVSVVDAGPIVPPNDEIWYTTIDNTTIDLSGDWPEYIILPYSGDKGVIKFTEDLTEIPVDGFESQDTLDSIAIPSSVTSIGDNAFYECYNLISVFIPDSVTSIGTDAFCECWSLGRVDITDIAAWCEITFSDNPLNYAQHLYVNNVEVTNLVIPNSVTSIGNSAFSGCSGLTSVVISDSVTSIGDNAFSGCSELTSIEISNSVTSIGIGAFFGCSQLTSVTIPNSVTIIGINAFYRVFNIEYHGSATGSPWGAKCVNGYIEGNFAYQDSTKTILVACHPNATGSIIIPNSVTSIREKTFAECRSLTSVTIPNSVTNIGNSAFYSCSALTSVNIPNTVTSIGNSAFSGCNHLTSITIPNGITSIENSTFSGCSELTSIEIPNSVTSIGSSAFYNCTKLSTVEIPSTVTSIGSSAFGNVFNINYSGSATGSPWGAKHVNAYVENDLCFSDSTKTILYGSPNASGDVVIPNTVTTINANAFNNCKNMTSVSIPSSVTSIGNNVFFRCTSLESAVINAQITKLPDRLFSECTSLNQVSHPTSVTDIGVRTFERCSSLDHVDLTGISNIGDYAFSSAGLEELYLPNTITVVGTYAFQYNQSLTRVEVEDGSTKISSHGFGYCNNLEKVIIPASVTSMNAYTFYMCPKLKTAGPIGGDYNIEYGWTDSIPDNAFSEATYLESFTFSNTLTTIGAFAFYNCIYLGIQFQVPSTITTIKSSAFAYIPNVIYGGSATGSSWGAYSVNGYCDDVLKMIFESSAKTELRYSYPDISGDIVIPNTVTTVKAAFAGNGLNITSITIPDSVTSVNYRMAYDISGSAVIICNGVTYEMPDYDGHDTYLSITLHNGTVVDLYLWPWTCVTGDTQVIVDEVGTMKKIEDLQSGDKILGYDFVNRNNILRKVKKIKTFTSQSVFEVTYEDGSILNITADHSMLTKDGWKAIHPNTSYDKLNELLECPLSIGDEVMSDSHEYKRIVNIQHIEDEKTVYHPICDDVYNSYYAGGVLVHCSGLKTKK